MSIKENVKRAKTDFDEVYNAGIEVGKKIGGESVAPNLQDKYITENGTYTPDDGYDGIGQVEVNVVTEPILQEKIATENGEYTPDEGYDGLSKVIVQVEASGDDALTEFFRMRDGYNLCYNVSNNVGLRMSITKKILELIPDGTLTNCGFMLREAYSGYNFDGAIPLFDTSNVTDMKSMFYGCNTLRLENIPLFNTSNVTDMKSMFNGCKALTSVHLFDTSKVTDMKSMFYNCEKLTSVPPFDTSNVTDMESMFYGCKALTSVPPFDTSNVTDMGSMFYSCSSLTEVPSFNMSNVTKTGNMFSGCSALTHVTVLGNIKTIGASTFYNCTALECLDLTACTSVPTLSNVNAFRNVPTTCQIKVPAHLYESWKSATNWSTYASQIVAVPVIKIDDDVYEIEEGMTWGEWIVSEYAPEGKFIVYVDNIRVAENNNYVVELQSGSPATPDTVMHSGDEYYQSEP